MMDEPNQIAAWFEENRPRLRTLAYRMLGSESQADDAVQEAWVRLSRGDAAAIENPAGWLTTVVSRICLDMLRRRATTRERSVETDAPEEIADRRAVDPEQQAILADSIGPALRVLLDRLGPAERAAFVLHDLFDVSFAEIATILGKTETASRQLASRARRRVRVSDSESVPRTRPDRSVVDAFLRATREGDLKTLLSLLHPECVLKPDAFAQLTGAPKPISGAANVAGFINGGSFGMRRATIDGVPGAAWVPHGTLRAAHIFTMKDDLIIEIEVIADKKRLAALDVVLLDAIAP